MFEEFLCPSGLCVICTKAAIAAQEFRILARNSNEAWNKTINVLNEISYSPPQQVKSICAFVSKDLSVQIVKDFVEGNPKYLVKRIKQSASERLSLIKPQRKTRVARGGPSCTCSDCGQEFHGPYYLNMHLKNSGRKEACLICGQILIRGQEMKDHLQNIHKQFMLMCKNCPLLFEKESELKKHVKVAHSSGALTCGDCGRTFLRNQAFEAHSQMHAVRTCRTCGVQFTNRSCYRRHRTQCEPDAKPNTQSLPRNKRSNVRDPAVYICDYCQKVYHSRPQLKNHIIWIHMNVRPHECQWCKKRFYTQTRLLEHHVVHTRERNFECDICGAKLVSKMAAIYHRRRHTGEKPYQCEDCEECFISASRRSEHAKRRHGKGYRFPCTECSLTFVRGHELRKHIVKAHKPKIDGQPITETIAEVLGV